MILASSKTTDAAFGIGVYYRCRTCGRPWHQVGGSYYDPREQVVVEQSPGA